MNVHEAVVNRRARRMIDRGRPVARTDINALVEAVHLSASCFNNQPWHLIFVRGSEALEEIKTALANGNEWATNASLIIVVAAKKEEDCVLGNREYFLFDCGLAIGQLVLMATERGMIAHPIAGFSQKKAIEILKIPDGYIVITLVICGYPGNDDSLLSDKQKAVEKERPERKPMEENFFLDKWGNSLSELTD